MKVPSDTILDQTPILGPDARLAMKALYLSFKQKLPELGDMTPTETINAFEELRRKGLIRVIQDGDRFRISFMGGRA